MFRIRPPAGSPSALKSDAVASACSSESAGAASGVQQARSSVLISRSIVTIFIDMSTLQTLERRTDPVERRGGDQTAQHERDGPVDRPALALAVDRVDDSGADRLLELFRGPRRGAVAREAQIGRARVCT